MKKTDTSSSHDSDGSVASFERQMRMENLETGTKKSRDYSKYMVIGVVVASLLLAIKWLNYFGFFNLVFIVAFVAGFYLYMQRLESKKVQTGAEGKDEMLRFKYPDEAIVHKLKRGVIWKGESSEQLVDSLGSPNSIKPLNGRDLGNAFWGYDRRVAYESSDGENRKKLVFEEGLLIELKEGIVVGWERKDTSD